MKRHFCNRVFYSDFEEIILGAVAEEITQPLAQTYGKAVLMETSKKEITVHNGQAQVTDSIYSAAPNLPYESTNTKSRIDRENCELLKRLTKAQGAGKNVDDSSPEVLLRDFTIRTDQETESKPSWMIPCFNSSVFGVKAIHEDVTGGQYDSELFTRFRELYFAEQSWMRRFFKLKEVKKISIVNSDLLPLGIASIRQRDHWPPPTERRTWIYVPCPPKTVPLLSQDILMHLWRNPHHSDQVAYQEWQNHSSCFKKLREQIRLLMAPPWFQRPPTPLQSQAPTKSVDPDPPVLPTRSAYIFVKIPKKIGDMLEPNYDDEAPEGWGILFEEGFRVHRLLIALLFLYFAASMAVIIWIIRTFGVIGPSNSTGMFGVLAWFSSFFSLLFTVWFKWAESG